MQIKSYALELTPTKNLVPLIKFDNGSEWLPTYDEIDTIHILIELMTKTQKKKKNA